MMFLKFLLCFVSERTHLLCRICTEMVNWKYLITATLQTSSDQEEKKYILLQQLLQVMNAVRMVQVPLRDFTSLTKTKIEQKHTALKKRKKTTKTF